MKGELNIKFQVSLFGDFSLITPTEDNIKKCIEGFFASGLLPGNLQEFDTQTNKMEPRISLQSMRNGLSVNILSNRLDFIAVPLPGSPAASLTFENFLQEVIKVSGLLQNTFNTAYKRIGVVTEKFLKEMTAERTDELRKVFIGEAFNVIPNSNIPEWNVRNVVLSHFDEPVSQNVNSIYSLARVKVQTGDASGHKEFDTLHLMIDINMPMDRQSPLSLEFIESFLKQSLELQRQINKGLSEVSYGAN